MSSRQIEMTWRCSSCSKKNLGRFKSCQGCANPKDGSEEYEMPDDPSKAASVTEEGLLRMATAGPDWRCAYCGSDQRRDDAGCGQCGASAVEGEEVPDAPPPPPKPPTPEALERQRAATARGKKVITWGCASIVIAVLSCIGFGAFASWETNRPKDYEARVTDVSWERAIAVERYQLKAHESFKETITQDALSVKSLGQREHHQEQVLDHYETERYTVQVPDGYRTESYTQRVSCGQDCTSTPQSCSEKCSSNKNGFATCRTVCSGGGQHCSTKYCDERRTKQVPKTRTEPRTRQVPRYRSEPRYAEFFSWGRWEWLPARTVRTNGTDVTIRWPESQLNQGLGAGEQEREQRTEKLGVTLTYDTDWTLVFAPTDEQHFATFAPGSTHALHTEQGTFTVDGAVVAPLGKGL